jgi:hypothetical protein
MRTALTAVAVIVAFAAALAAGKALGQPAGVPGGPAQRSDFMALDRNRDGVVSKVEALADREVWKRFADFDTDKDGLLTEAEFVMAKEDNQKRILRDALITARVKAALLAEKGIPSTAISVETYEGRVQLSGFVRSPDTASRAGRLTSTVAGVRTVENNLTVK